MALSRRRVLAQEQSADSNADNTEKKPQDETNEEGPQSNKEDFVHYLLERPILLLLLDREDVVRSLRNLYF